MPYPKLTYPDKKIAKRFAKRKGNIHGEKMEVYRCGHCGQWHMTKKKTASRKIFYRTKGKELCKKR